MFWKKKEDIDIKLEKFKTELLSEVISIMKMSPTDKRKSLSNEINKSRIENTKNRLEIFAEEINRKKLEIETKYNESVRTNREDKELKGQLFILNWLIAGVPHA